MRKIITGILGIIIFGTAFLIMPENASYAYVLLLYVACLALTTYLSRVVYVIYKDYKRYPIADHPPDERE
jgi:hypothetical protein